MYDRFIAIIKNKVEVVSKHFTSLSEFSQKICIEMSLKCKPYHIIDYGNNIIYCLSVIFNKAYLRHSGPARPAGGLDPESHTEF